MPERADFPGVETGSREWEPLMDEDLETWSREALIAEVKRLRDVIEHRPQDARAGSPRKGSPERA